MMQIELVPHIQLFEQFFTLGNSEVLTSIELLEGIHSPLMSVSFCPLKTNRVAGLED